MICIKYNRSHKFWARVCHIYNRQHLRYILNKWLNRLSRSQTRIERAGEGYQQNAEHIREARVIRQMRRRLQESVGNILGVVPSLGRRAGNPQWSCACTRERRRGLSGQAICPSLSRFRASCRYLRISVHRERAPGAKCAPRTHLFATRCVKLRSLYNRSWRSRSAR